jgi:hypothetical protein
VVGAGDSNLDETPRAVELTGQQTVTIVTGVPQGRPVTVAQVAKQAGFSVRTALRSRVIFVRGCPELKAAVVRDEKPLRIAIAAELALLPWEWQRELLKKKYRSDLPATILTAREVLAKQGWKPRTATCAFCDAEFQATRWDQSYCSNACRQKAYRQRRTK